MANLAAHAFAQPAPGRLGRAGHFVYVSGEIGIGGAVVTDHRNGCIVWEDSRQTRYPAFDVPEVDPTGAGDVFATAFLLRYAETRDPAAGARFANCAASFVVEGPGTSVLPTQEQVEGRLRSGKTRPPA